MLIRKCLFVLDLWKRELKNRMSWGLSEIAQCVNVLATKADDLYEIPRIHAVEG